MGSQDDGIRRREGGARHLVAHRARSAALLAAVVAGAPFVQAPAVRANPAAAAVMLARTDDPAPLPPAATALDAVLIYDRAHAAVAARSLPPFIAYTQTVTFSRHGTVRRTERSRIVLRTADGRANVTPLGPGDTDGPAGPAIVKDRPLIFPTTTFGFVRAPGETPSAYEPDALPAPAASGPSVIGRVRAATRDYDPTLAGMTSIRGRPAYLLRLAPRSDPEHHRIRAMTVDAQTFEPLVITIEVYAHAGPISSKPTAVATYAPIGGTWLIAHAAIDFVARFGFFAYGGDGRLTLADVAFPPSEPDALFARR